MINKNKVAAVALALSFLLIAYSNINVVFAGLTTSAGASSESQSISASVESIKPAVSNSKPKAKDPVKPSTGGVVFTKAMTEATDLITSRGIFVSAANVTPGTFNSAVGPIGDYGFPGNISLVPSTNSSTGVIYKGTNRFIHNFALAGTLGYNTFVGVDSGNFNMAHSVDGQGSFNTGVGHNTLTNNTTGDHNTANGSFSLYSNTTGVRNTASGHGSLYSNVTGDNNTATGFKSLYSNNTGSFNTAYGVNSGYSMGVPLNTMTNSTFLGYNANSSADGITNSTAIGNGAQVTRSNQVVIGNANVTQTVLRGNVAIGGRLCVWNGANYTVIRFAPSSITPIYSTSTSC
jgi:hypothetical protein